MKLLIELWPIAIGGALGAICRFTISEWASGLTEGDFPVGTLIANVVGCLLIGVLIGSGKADTSVHWRLGFGTGFLGALTTFSTFGAETIKASQDGHWGVAGMNIGVNLVLGLAAVVAGLWIGKAMSGEHVG